VTCTNPEEGTVESNIDESFSLPKDSISYELFRVGMGYGFNILKNGKVYIHQPIIPTWTGFHVFPTIDAADAMASLITKKMTSNNFRFLLEKPEVDEEMKIFFTSGNHMDSIDEIKLNQFLPYADSLKTSISLAGAPVDALRDLPVKRKWRLRGIVPFGARTGAISFTANDCIYIGAGEFKDLKARDLWCYNPVSDSWTCMAEFPGERRMSGVGFSLYDNGYWSLGTGQMMEKATAFFNDLYEYITSENVWVKKDDFPGSPRVDAASFVVHNRAYLGLGYATDYRADIYEYDPVREKKWRRIADFAGGPISSPIGIGVSNSGFIIAGDRLSNSQRFVYEYLPSEDKWQKKKDFPADTRYNLSGCIIDSNIFLAGGGGQSGELRFRDFYTFNVLKNEWVPAEDYPISKNGITKGAGGNVKGRVYLGTGHNGKYLNDWNEFEYYFSVRPTPGEYNETCSYPLQYNGQWELFQECSSDDCFAGVEIKSNQALGNFYYSSRYVQDLRTIMLKSADRNKLLVFPRNFSIRTEREPREPVSLRLFFTKKELEKAFADCNKKTGEVNSRDKLQILQCIEKNPDTDPTNNSFQKNAYSLIKPQWYSYGFDGETIVAEFPVTSLHSEFYLVVQAR
jgi:N-acetylneuraminic acid mutarotase